MRFRIDFTGILAGLGCFLRPKSVPSGLHPRHCIIHSRVPKFNVVGSRHLNSLVSEDTGDGQIITTEFEQIASESASSSLKSAPTSFPELRANDVAQTEREYVTGPVRGGSVLRQDGSERSDDGHP